MVRKLPQHANIAVGLSGGVDSSVTALVLKKAGYAVTGVHMQCWDYDVKGCSGKQDRADAVAVAAKLDVPFVSLDFVKEYSDLVLQHFYSEYQAGRTPNPDVLCNREIKFGLFLKWARANGFDYVATGHYADIDCCDGTGLLQLKQPVDLSKDQTYFLYELNQAQLKHALFPLSTLAKTDVRRMAALEGLTTATKPDSVGICFVGNVEIREFLKEHGGFVEQEGAVLDTHGKVIGKHTGAVFFTIGQRHGFTVTDYAGVPLYVLAKDISKNELVVGTYEECLSADFELEAINWIGNAVTDEFECQVRIRHLGKLYEARVFPKELKVKLAERAFGIAPGQSAVFYQSSVVLGGGVIA